MAYCKNCGAQIDDKAVICPKCGVAQAGTVTEPDTGNIGWGVLGFFLPLIGLILYLILQDTRPLTARMAGKGALISVILGLALTVMLFIFSACSIGMLASVY